MSSVSDSAAVAAVASVEAETAAAGSAVVEVPSLSIPANVLSKLKATKVIEPAKTVDNKVPSGTNGIGYAYILSAGSILKSVAGATNPKFAGRPLRAKYLADSLCRTIEIVVYKNNEYYRVTRDKDIANSVFGRFGSSEEAIAKAIVERANSYKENSVKL